MTAPQPGGISLLGDNLVFLIGLPRSGTTLLSHMLGNHPAIAAPPEPWVMLALHQLGRADRGHPANATVMQQAVENFAGPDGLIAAARAAAAALYNARLLQSGKAVLVDKTPRYLFILDYVRAVFPLAKIVCLLRDPFDIAASFRSSFGANLPAILDQLEDSPFLFDFTIGLDRLDRLVASRDSALHVVRYEDLVASPAAVLGGVVEAIGLSATPAILAAMCKLNPKERQPGEFGDRKIEQTTAPHTASIGAYRTAFTRQELQSLMNGLGLDRLQRLGYASTASALAALGVVDRSAANRPVNDAKAAAMFQARLSAQSGSAAGVDTHGNGLRRVIQVLRGSRP